MLTIALPRPPRLDLLLVAIILASGLAFFAVCADAHAESATLSTTTWASAPASTVFMFGDRELMQADSAGVHLSRDVDVAGDRIATERDISEVSLDNLMRSFHAQADAERYASNVIDEKLVYYAKRDDVDAALMPVALGSGVVGALVTMLFGITLFSRSFAMRRWIARAHRRILEREAAQQARSHL